MTKPVVKGTLEDDNDVPCHGAYDPPHLYAGHTDQYWGDMAINWLPFFLLLIFLYFLFAGGGKRQQSYLKKYDRSIETQEKAYQELLNTNKLLAQIVEKLDKKAL